MRDPVETRLMPRSCGRADSKFPIYNEEGHHLMVELYQDCDLIFSL